MPMLTPSSSLLLVIISMAHMGHRLSNFFHPPSFFLRDICMVGWRMHRPLESHWE